MKMKYEEIIKLLDAGYSREEILAMKEAPAEDPTPQEDDPADMSAVLNEMREMFSDMRNEITAMNIMNSRMPAEQEKTSEEIIANIISPVKSKE